MMGGNSRKQTSTARRRSKGLYAAGECACVSMNGANRLVHSLTECSCSEPRRPVSRPVRDGAGRGQCSNPVSQLVSDERRAARHAVPQGRRAGADRPTYGKRMQKSMESGAHLPGTGRAWKRPARRFASCVALREHRAPDRDAVFNTEVIAAMEPRRHAGRGRGGRQRRLLRESRAGRTTRTDFRSATTRAFPQHSLALPDAPRRPRNRYLPVTITRWAPRKGKY